MFARLGSLLLLPVYVLHEATHVVSGLPWARDWWVEYQRTRVTTRIEFADETPTWAVYWVHLSPFFVGLAAMLAAVACLALGWVRIRVASPLDVVVLSIAAVAWLKYAWPSPRDRNPSRTQEAARD